MRAVPSLACARRGGVGVCEGRGEGNGSSVSPLLTGPSCFYNTLWFQRPEELLLVSL